MAIVFITGGNKGLSYEAAKRLIQMGHRVYIGSRNKDGPTETFVTRFGIVPW